MVQILLYAGHNCEENDNDGLMQLSYAQRECHEEIV